MTKMRNVGVAALVAVALTAAPARADKMQQAKALWQTHCASCHVVGHGQAVKGVPHNFTDLTMATRTHDDAWLSQWIQSPTSVDPDARCYTAGLELRHIDLLIAFLRLHARPLTKHVVPAAQSKPPRPPEPKPEPPKGLVRGR
jgi:cytochrome c2